MAPENPSATQKYLFVHLPKTGGTTMRYLLNRIYGDTCLTLGHKQFHPYRYSTEAMLEAFCGMERRNDPDVQVISGHMFFGLHEFLEGDWRYVTLLRHPVERVLSGFYYLVQLKRLPVDGLMEYISGKNETLLHQMAVNNLQTRYLSAVGGVPVVAPFGVCPPGMLDAARLNLETHFIVAGLTERFDETLMLLKNTFDWPQPLYTSENRTLQKTAPHKLPAEVLDIITENNALDIALYDAAKARFESELSRQDPQFIQAVRAFKRQNTMARLHQRVRNLLPF
jgi:hypothetical protein